MTNSPDDEATDLPHLDPRLRWLSEGTLTNEQLAWLREEAVGNEELELALQALAPLDDRVFAEVAQKVHGAAPAGAESAAARAAPPSAVRPWARPVTRLVGAVPLAAAALLALTNGLAKPLPVYQFEWHAGQRTEDPTAPVTRAGDPPAATDLAARRFRTGDAVDLTLRPALTRTGSLQVLVFADGRPVDAPVELFPETGTVRVRGVIGTPPWDLAAGEHALTVAVGPARALHFGSTLVDPRWQRFTVPLVVD